MTPPDVRANTTEDSQPIPRRPWVTPSVITSQASGTEVGNNTFVSDHPAPGFTSTGNLS